MSHTACADSPARSSTRFGRARRHGDAFHLAVPGGTRGAAPLPWPYLLSREVLLAKILAYSAVDASTRILNGVRCRTWRRSLQSKGYGLVCIGGGRSTSAHRVLWQCQTGDVLPRNIVPDHLCKNHACVEWRHLDPVTERVNILRGDSKMAVNARKTECDSGHQLSGKNLLLVQKKDGVHRQCHECQKVSQRRSFAKWYAIPENRAAHVARMAAGRAAKKAAPAKRARRAS